MEQISNYSSSIIYMYSKIGSRVLYWLCALVLLCNSCEGVNLKISAIIAFGDSLLDQGNNNLLNTVLKCNFKPYGKDFPGRIPTGRFCNGKTLPDLFAERLGVKNLVPAYADPGLKIQDLSTGVSFASGGSGYDLETPQLTKVLPLSDQLAHFEEYIGKLKGVLGEKGTNTILGNSLVVVSSGSNDLILNYYGTGTRRAQYNVSSYTDLLVSSASTFIKALYEVGVRKIAVMSMPPVGCLPSQRTLGGGSLRMCAESSEQTARLFNTKLQLQLDALTKTLPLSRLVFVDIYSPLLDMIQHPQKYGFVVSDRGCCGTGTIEVVITCNRNTETCPDDTKYVFWDSAHPTERAYTILADHVIARYGNIFG